MPVRTLPLLLMVLLSGCSVSNLLPDGLSTDPGPEPAYRYIVATHLQGIVGDPSSSGTFEISTAKRVDAIAGASWLVCLKIQKFPLLPRYYAVFIQNDRITDSRVSVLIDQCEREAYTPFDWAADAAKLPSR